MLVKIIWYDFISLPITKLQIMKRDPSAIDGSEDLGDQYKDERTEKKIHDHLNNENDVITEEDIANAPVGLVHKEPHPVESAGEPKLPEENKVKDNEDPDIDTSWNVLES